MAERVFTLPDLGEGLEEGRIVHWLVAEGDEVALNQPLVEIETAKAIVEIPSPYAGRVASMHGAEGEDVPVGAPLVTFEVAGDDAPDGFPRSRSPARSRSSGDVVPRSTPPIRKLAKELGVDLAGVKGTGPEGRITGEDVRGAAGGGSVASAGVEVVTVSPTRRAIARNLERQAAIPQVTTFRTLDCTELDAFRRELDVSPLPVLVAGLCRVVKDHPMLNAAWHDDAIHVSSGVHVGLAVDTERGLVVPAVQNAQERGIGDLAAEIVRLADRARGATLTRADLAAPTIAVSNTGSYGSEAGTPILSPGTSVTLAFGTILPRALVIDGVADVRPAATLSLTFDHRVLDGAAVGRALSDLVGLLQSAERLRDLPR